MKPSGIKLAAVVVFSALSLLGQPPGEENNWYRETNRGDNWFSRFDFSRYTEEDVQIAKTKYLRITGSLTLNEWEGTYHQPVMLGYAELPWSIGDGFVKAYTYHTLAGLDYGRIVTSPEKVIFYSEKPATRSGKLADEYITVKFGNTHFLIPEKYLRNFAERAAGFTTRSDENEYYWIKIDDENKKVLGLPLYPKRYLHLIRRPIQAKILSIGKPRLRQAKFENGEVYAEYFDRLISFDAGSIKGLEVDMFLYSDDLDEWIQIVRVGKNRSFGKLSRSISKSRQEVCFEDESSREKERPCLALRSRVFARTLSQEFDFQ